MSSTRPPAEPPPERRDGAGNRAREESRRNVAKAGGSLVRGLISLVILVALAGGLLLAVPGLHGVLQQVEHMQTGWVVGAVIAEILSCASYILAFLQVFERSPLRLGARVALSELAFGSAVSLGGAGSAAVGTWLLVERGADPVRVAERSAVLFLLTTAINVFTLTVAGFALWLGILPGSGNPLLSLLPAAICLIGTIAVLLLPRYADRLASHVSRPALKTFFTQTAQTVRDTRSYLFRADWRILGAIGYLWFDIAALGMCFAAAGHPAQVSTLILAYQIGYLANFIPIPGGLGVLDGSLVGMFVLYHVSAATATAATVVYHGIALWIPAMWGTAAFLILRRSRGEPLRLRPPRDERRRLREEQRRARAAAGGRRTWRPRPRAGRPL